MAGLVSYGTEIGFECPVCGAEDSVAVRISHDSRNARTYSSWVSEIRCGCKLTTAQQMRLEEKAEEEYNDERLSRGG